MEATLMPSTCPHCGIGFNHWNDYHEHLASSHRHMGLESKARPLPANYTGRSKAQIVREAEASWLRPLIVTTSNEQEHLDACRCNECWLKLADKLIQSQEKWI